MNFKEMKKSGFILFAFALLSLSCVKDKGLEAVFADEYISLDAAPGATKGFLNTGDLVVNGTKFQMFDYLSGYNGTISGHSGGTEFEYFSNTLTYKSDAANWKWLFGDVASPDSYKWTRTGTHHFFGWMLKDATGGASDLQSDTFFSTWTPGTKSLTVGKNLTIATPQYDFLYSDVIPVNVTANGIPASVPMPMNHLFGAVGLTLSNDSDLDVIVYSVSFQNFPNRNTVTLDYSDLDNGVNLNYNQPTYANGSVYFANQLSSSITLYNRNHATQAEKVYDAITGADITDSEPAFYMAWPVLRSSLEPVGTTYDGDGNPVYASNAPLILVDCKVGTQARKIVKLKFPAATAENPWFIRPGKKTKVALQFLNKQISLSFTIRDWQFEKYPMSYEDDAISATQLKFTLNTYIGSEERINGVKHAIIKLTSSSTAGSYIATGSFKIFTPVNGTLSVGLGGNADDFAVSLQSGDATSGGTESITINPNRDGGKITLTVRPVGTPAHGSRCFLHFGVRNNGRDSEADSEINRDGYIVEFP